jgi:hypothetical protein
MTCKRNHLILKSLGMDMDLSVKLMGPIFDYLPIGMLHFSFGPFLSPNVKWAIMVLYKGVIN